MLASIAKREQARLKAKGLLRGVKQALVELSDLTEGLSPCEHNP